MEKHGSVAAGATVGREKKGVPIGTTASFECVSTKRTKGFDQCRVYVNLG